jgi:transcriptional regulator with XRE-family HTH domain
MATDTVGFAGALRGWRRRRHVSQLELAERAGTTQRYVSFIEGGRSVPGRAVVVRLAEALDVPLRERNALLLSAGYAPAYEETALDDRRLGAVRAALERILEGHLPYPAVITDRLGDLVSDNDAFRPLVEGVAPALLAPPVNIARLLLHPLGMAPRILNLDVWGVHVVDAVRQRSLRDPDERIRALAAELEQYVPRRPPEPVSDYRGVAVPLRLRLAGGELQLLTTLAHFRTTTDVTLAELTLEAFLPADDATGRALAAMTRTARHRSGSASIAASHESRPSSEM